MKAGGGAAGLIITILFIVLASCLNGGLPGGGSDAGGLDTSQMVESDTGRYDNCETGEDANKDPDCARVLVENSLRHGAGAVGLTVRTARGAGGMVVLEVSDEGSGVPEGLMPHMFDRGVSTASSTGIGLGLARAFVEADGGRLELRRAVPPIFAIFLAVGPSQGLPSGTPTEPDRSGTAGSGTAGSGTSADPAAAR
jgi:hypothetical protein